MTRTLAVIVGLILLCAAGPASAWGDESFARCDGFGRPSPTGDGMVEGASNWGNLFDPTTGNADGAWRVTFDAAGLAACDSALASPYLEAKYWLRRVHLLRAKALHQMASGDDAAALATLDQATATATAADGPDIFYRRSEGLSVEMTRAVLLARLGRLAEAQTLALQQWELRPFNRGVTMAALAAWPGEANSPQAERLSLRLHQLDAQHFSTPTYAALMFTRASTNRRVAAEFLYGVLPKPETRETFLTYGKTLKRWQDFEKPWVGLRATDFEKSIWTRGWGSIAMVEELALLQAAEFAREKGRSSFIIFRRDDVRWYQDGAPAGVVTTLQITSVDPAQMSSYFVERKARLIPVAEVNAALAYAYGEAAARRWPGQPAA